MSLYDLASVDSWEENSVLEIIAFHCRSPVSLAGQGVHRRPPENFLQGPKLSCLLDLTYPIFVPVGVWLHVLTLAIGPTLIPRSSHTRLRHHAVEGLVLASTCSGEEGEALCRSPAMRAVWRQVGRVHSGLPILWPPFPQPLH